MEAIEMLRLVARGLFAPPTEADLDEIGRGWTYSETLLLSRVEGKIVVLDGTEICVYDEARERYDSFDIRFGTYEGRKEIEAAIGRAR